MNDNNGENNMSDRSQDNEKIGNELMIEVDEDIFEEELSENVSLESSQESGRKKGKRRYSNDSNKSSKKYRNNGDGDKGRQENDKLRNNRCENHEIKGDGCSKSKSRTGDVGSNNRNQQSLKEGFYFIPIGGCTEIGMNLYAYIYNDQWILVDMGMGFDNELGRELLVPSPETLLKNKSKIKALFVTHSHEDHIGAIPYLWPMLECPIYGRSFAIEMIRDKLQQFSLEQKVPLVKVTPGNKIEVGDFSVEYICVAHSTPESSALAIKTPAGTVIHSGDWRLDDDPVLGSKTDETKLKEYGDDGVLALVCDSTNVFREEHYGSEKSVRETLIELVKTYKKNRILVACFASNLARLETCFLAAKESGRQLVVTGRSIKKIERIARLSGYFQKIPAFIEDRKINTLDPSKVLIVCTGSQGESGSALNKIALGTHKFVTLTDNDVVIFSSRVIPGNELDVLAVQNALIKKRATIITDADCAIHASGHPSREELRHLYSLVRPGYLIPVHGETMQLYKHAEIGSTSGMLKEAIVPHDGCVIRLAKNHTQIVDGVDVGLLAVDGNKLLPVDGVVYKQRKALSINGFVSAIVKYRKGNGGYIKLLEMTSYGVFEPSEQEEFRDIRDDIASEIKLSLENISRGKRSVKEVQCAVEKIIRNIFVDIREKKPVVMVHVLVD